MASYLVLFKLTRDRRIKIGKLKTFYFKKGQYLYVGSFPKQWIQNRISRHKMKNKKLHWHIDYFSKDPYVRFLTSRVFFRKECNLALDLHNKFSCVNKFGSSDCKCAGHLFYSRKNVDISDI